MPSRNFLKAFKMTGIAIPRKQQPLVSIEHPNIDIDLVYATERNFTGRSLYQDARAMLVPEAAQALNAAANFLERQGFRLVVLDAFRPVGVQRMLWKIRPDPEFVADPEIGSDHSRGVAVDVTLSNGSEYLNMGTDFDAAVPQSHHDRQDIPTEAQLNRDALRQAMKVGGFEENPFEWWHYSLRNASSYQFVDW